ncbi:MAG: hypothetical protein IJ168_01835 [Eubacterium sp.]|nr:hypothetical protein [Eubacterium sp.]
MKKELPYFYIGASYGGNQDWFSTFMMRLGGCGAETACEVCIYLDLYKGCSLYPFDKNNLTKADYVAFADVMKPYLHPRMSGIDRLSLYIDGFGAYLRDRGSAVMLSGVEGTEPVEVAAAALKSQLDSGLPVPFLCLNHHDPRFKDYEWHWFILNGYEERDGALWVKAVTYSMYEWLDFAALWASGRAKKGGLILLELPDNQEE